jgi:hypothetical protein
MQKIYKSYIQFNLPLEKTFLAFFDGISSMENEYSDNFLEPPANHFSFNLKQLEFSKFLEFMMNKS